ncbi:hypothetical protein BH24CHL1_BH24CHL1_08850 [soil metagenome]
MTYLLDSDWMSNYLAQRRSAVAFIDPLVPDGLAISIITFTKVYEGIYFGRRPEHFEAVFLQFLEGVVVLELSQPVARLCARLRGSLRRTGQLIAFPDLLIAATALHRDLTLVTRNRQHFERIPNLKLLSAPSEPADT